MGSYKSSKWDMGPRGNFEQAKALWLVGTSGTDIAEKLGAGFTRSSVIAKMNREGIFNPKQQKNVSNGSGRKRKRRLRGVDGALASALKKTMTAPVPDLEIVHVEPTPPGDGFLHIELLDLTEKTCRFPAGDDQFTFCGQETKDGSSYCGYHRGISTQGQKRILLLGEERAKVA